MKMENDKGVNHSGEEQKEAKESPSKGSKGRNSLHVMIELRGIPGNPKPTGDHKHRPGQGKKGRGDHRGIGEKKRSG